MAPVFFIYVSKIQKPTANSLTTDFDHWILFWMALAFEYKRRLYEKTSIMSKDFLCYVLCTF